MIKTDEKIENNQNQSTQNDIRKKRIEIDKKIKDGTYMIWLTEKHGVMTMDDIITDKEFLQDMIHAIEDYREKTIVYNVDYKRSDLEEWKRKNNRKLLLRRVSEKVKERKKKETILDLGLGLRDIREVK